MRKKNDALVENADSGKEKISDLPIANKVKGRLDKKTLTTPADKKPTKKLAATKKTKKPEKKTKKPEKKTKKPEKKAKKPEKKTKKPEKKAKKPEKKAKKPEKKTKTKSDKKKTTTATKTDVATPVDKKPTKKLAATKKAKKPEKKTKAKSDKKKTTTTTKTDAAKPKPKPSKKAAKKIVVKPVKVKKLTKKELEEAKKEAERTLEEELEEQLSDEEIENFQIEKVDMERLTNKICDVLAERESSGMFQSELWKKLKLTGRDGARLALKLERMGTITREKLLENNRWTYKLILKKTPISTQSIEKAPCLVCPVEQKCSLDGAISPITCQLIEDWVILELKKPVKSK